MKELCAILLALWVLALGVILLTIYQRGWDIRCVPTVMPLNDSLCQGIPLPNDPLCEPAADLWLCGLWAPYTDTYPE